MDIERLYCIHVVLFEGVKLQHLLSLSTCANFPELSFFVL